MTSAVDVLLITNNFPPMRNGSAVVYDSLARTARRRIMVLAPRRSERDGLPLIGWREHDRQAKFPVARLPLFRPPMDGLRQRLPVIGDLLTRLRFAWFVMLLLLRERPRAVCVGGLPNCGWIIALLRYVPRLQTLAFVQGEEIAAAGSFEPTKQRCQGALRAANGIFVASPSGHAMVLALLDAAEHDKVRLIRGAVDSDRFTPGEKRPDLLARFGLANCFVFISVCRLLEQKGVDNALRAFAQVADPSDRFLVVGTGPYEASLLILVEELGILDRVVFAGWMEEEDLADCYRLGDAFVMPNRTLPNGDTEGFGLVFLEANASGVPVLAGRDGGSADTVRDGINGLVVNGGSVAEIANAMRRLRDDSVLRTRLRLGGLDAAARASWDQQARTFLSFSEALSLERSQ